MLTYLTSFPICMVDKEPVIDLSKNASNKAMEVDEKDSFLLIL